MKRFLPIALLVGLVALGGGLFLVFGGFGHAQAETFHINYDRGRDDADGLTAAAAWKHAPGDPNAGGVAGRTRLGPGDKVLFAGGVRYRGEILVSASGTGQQPIVFAGEGAGEAIIDGSEPATITPCASAAECAGAPQWRQLVRITPAKQVKEILAVFTTAGPLRPAQGPDPKNDFYRDEIDDMAQVDGVAMSQGRVQLPHAIAAGLASGGGRLALWVKPNLVVERPILGMDGDVARFDPAGLQYYTDRPSRAAAMGHVSLIDRPGEYVLLADGQTVVAMLPPGARDVSLGTGRGGFHLRKASYVTFRGLAFENMADGGALPPAGVAVFADGGEGLLVEGSRFSNFVMERGQGPIITRRVNNIRVAGNRIETVTLGSGMRLGGPATGVVVEDNQIRRIGRTGIMLMEIDHGVVQRNRITDISGVHGNGLSAYLGNHDISFLANTVLDAKQPATFHGVVANSTHDNDLVFANNLFVAQPDALGALISWGHTRGVSIRNNVLLGGRAGVRMNENDQGVTIADNVASGLLYGRAPPTAWTIVGNEWTTLSFQQKKDATAAPSGRFKNAGDELEKGRVPAGVCDVIRRHSAGPAKAETPGAVGAELKCP